MVRTLREERRMTTQPESDGSAGPPGRQSPDSRIVALVSEAASRMDERQPRIARGMSDLIAREVKYLDADDQILELMHASTDANVKTVIHVLINNIPIEHLQPTTAAVEYAIRLAQRDIPSNSLVRAYHVGKDDFIEQIFPDVQALDCTSEDKFAVLHHMSMVAGQYVDWISQYVFDVYEQERLRWISARGNVHASFVHEMLNSKTSDGLGFEAETGYRLEPVHVGVVIWTVRNKAVPDELRLLQQVVRKMASAANCVAPPLTTAVDRGTAWAWLPFAARPSPDQMAALSRVVAESDGCRVSLGLPARGITGFRRTHAQAQASRSVAAIPGKGASPVVSFGDDGVAVTALLARDIESTRLWIAEVLGRLAVDDDRSATLRETLRVFYLTGENYTETAELMNLHRNTVKYRVEKALEERDSTVTSNRIDIAVALNVCHFLGSSVLVVKPRR